jgi:hypothetical protein
LSLEPMAMIPWRPMSFTTMHVSSPGNDHAPKFWSSYEPGLPEMSQHTTLFLWTVKTCIPPGTSTIWSTVSRSLLETMTLALDRGQRLSRERANNDRYSRSVEDRALIEHEGPGEGRWRANTSAQNTVYQTQRSLER